MEQIYPIDYAAIGKVNVKVIKQTANQNQDDSEEEKVVVKKSDFDRIMQLIGAIKQEFDKENDELIELYGDRVNTPKEQWHKDKKEEDLYKSVMKHKKENGWRFKDE